MVVISLSSPFVSVFSIPLNFMELAKRKKKSRRPQEPLLSCSSILDLCLAKVNWLRICGLIPTGRMSVHVNKNFGFEVYIHACLIPLMRFFPLLFLLCWVLKKQKGEQSGKTGKQRNCYCGFWIVLVLLIVVFCDI